MVRLDVAARQNEPPVEEAAQAAEWCRCAASPIYFLATYGWLFNATEQRWRDFDLWPAQAWVLTQLQRHPLVVMLKARQLGMTWLVLGYGLWLLLFRPAAVVGVFSRTEDDAIELLDFRLKGIYARLPGFLRCRAVVGDNKSRWALSNGSVAMAFPTTGGRQYTFSFILVDEADHQPDLAGLMTAAKPTIDAGGAMVLLSSVNKRKPLSPFKQVYRAARQGYSSRGDAAGVVVDAQVGESGRSGWRAIFLPWSARPERTAAWYAAQRAEILARTGALDDLHQEYPASETEALAPLSLDKRIPGAWLEACFAERRTESAAHGTGGLSIAQLEVYREPEADRAYVIGCDPAEGNPTSDESALVVLDVESGEEVAALAGRFQPAVLAGHAGALADWYNGAGILVERNNHGHAVLLALAQEPRWRNRLVRGRDKRGGWQSSALGKTILYDALAETLRDGDLLLHSLATFTQVASIEGSSLRAPEGQADDRADALALANLARRLGAQGVSAGGY